MTCHWSRGMILGMMSKGQGRSTPTPLVVDREGDADGPDLAVGGHLALGQGRRAETGEVGPQLLGRRSGLAGGPDQLVEERSGVVGRPGGRARLDTSR